MEIEKAFRAYGRGNMSLQAVKLPISHNNVLEEHSSPTQHFGDWCTHTRGSHSTSSRWR